MPKSIFLSCPLLSASRVQLLDVCAVICCALIYSVSWSKSFARALWKGVPGSFSKLKAFIWLTAEVQTWTTHRYLSLRCWGNSWSGLPKCLTHSTPQNVNHVILQGINKPEVVFFYRLNYTQWSNVLLLEQAVATLLWRKTIARRAGRFQQSHGVPGTSRRSVHTLPWDLVVGFACDGKTDWFPVCHRCWLNKWHDQGEHMCLRFFCCCCLFIWVFFPPHMDLRKKLTNGKWACLPRIISGCI